MKKYTEELLAVDVNDVRNSVILDHLADCYHQINYCKDLLDTVDATKIIHQFNDLVHKNEELLRTPNQAGLLLHTCNNHRVWDRLFFDISFS